MLAEQSLQDGKLEDALTQLEDQVRNDPSNARHRVFLFQLLCILGHIVGVMDRVSGLILQVAGPAVPELAVVEGRVPQARGAPPQERSAVAGGSHPPAPLAHRSPPVV